MTFDMDDIIFSSGRRYFALVVMVIVAAIAGDYFSKEMVSSQTDDLLATIHRADSTVSALTAINNSLKKKVDTDKLRIQQMTYERDSLAIVLFYHLRNWNTITTTERREAERKALEYLNNLNDD